LSFAYPGGDTTIPLKKRPFLQLPNGEPILDHLANNQAVRDCCETVPLVQTEGARAYLFRLGCCHYPHLKLKAQLMEDGGENVWVLSVVTHDSFSPTSFLPPPDHPDLPAWRKLQAANVALKTQIEAAWDQAGLLTFNGLLRRHLPRPLEGSG
jgi:hypothetical protein